MAKIMKKEIKEIFKEHKLGMIFIVLGLISVIASFFVEGDVLLFMAFCFMAFAYLVG